MTCTKQDSQVITKKVKSKYVIDREVSIYVPGEKYGTGPWPVIYMHDGQTLFQPSALTASEWEVDETMERLMAEGFSPHIVVGIHNTRLRYQEYLPQKPDCVQGLGVNAKRSQDKPFPKSDDYLKFIVKELKPKIDRQLPTKKDRANTFIAGSSMGGLISLYALNEYPEVFGGAACLSTHWPLNIEGGHNNDCADDMIKYFGHHLPAPKNHKVYFDFGTEGSDADYEYWQLKMDVLMRKAHYKEGKQWQTKKFEGHGHAPEFWKQRFEGALRFLLED